MLFLHFAILFLKKTTTTLNKTMRRKNSDAITVRDVIDFMVANYFCWCWIFLTVFYDKNSYTNVIDDQPGKLYSTFIKFLAYSSISTNGGTTTIEETNTVSEVFSALCAAYYQTFIVLLIGGFAANIFEKLSNDRKEKRKKKLKNNV